MCDLWKFITFFPNVLLIASICISLRASLAQPGEAEVKNKRILKWDNLA